LLREAVVVGAYAAVMTPATYWTIALVDLLLLKGWSRETISLESLWWYIKNHYNDVGIYFHPPPSWILSLGIGAIAMLVWCSGRFWCRLVGRRLFGNAVRYDGPERIVRRCRLLGGLAGIPAFVAVAAY
jgi:hypothetical protein